MSNIKVENFLNKPLYCYVLDYIKSKNFEVVLSKYHETQNTIDCGDPFILLEDYKEKMRKVEIQLKKARKNQLTQKKVIMKEYALFEEKETVLKNNFIRFNKFIKENKEKRERGVVRMEEDKQTALKWENKSANLKVAFDKLQNCKNLIEEAIKKHKIYENFFMKCCGDLFKLPSEIIERYELLLETRQKLLEQQNQILMTLENFKIDLKKQAEAAKLVILGLNTKIFNLQDRYENSRFKSNINENLIIDIFRVAGERMEEIVKTKSTVQYMYKEMDRSASAISNNEDFRYQLSFIKNSLGHFERINKTFKKLLEHTSFNYS